MGGVNVLIISSAIVGDEAHAGPCQCFDYFTLYPPRDGDTFKGAVDGLRAVEGTGAAFLQEIGRVGRFGGDEVGEGGEGIVGFAGWFAGSRTFSFVCWGSIEKFGRELRGGEWWKKNESGGG